MAKPRNYSTTPESDEDDDLFLGDAGSGPRAPLPELEAGLRREVVPAEAAGTRIDKWIVEVVPGLSRTRAQSLVVEGRVRVAGEVVPKNYPVEAGQEVEVEVPPGRPLELVPAKMKLDVIFEDKHLIAINKPSGLVVHPGAATGDDTLVHGLLHHCAGQLSGIGGVERPGIVHRLDKETSGVIVVAKTDAAHQGLAAAFAAREVEKRYLAIVNGHPRLLSGTVMEPIGRDPKLRLRMAIRKDGRMAHTDWELVEKLGPRAALVRLDLHTGRTHQIRVHLSHLGHPIVGDRLYAGRRTGLIETAAGERFYLHAERLSVDHPVTGKRLELIARPGRDFEAMAARMRAMS